MMFAARRRGRHAVRMRPRAAALLFSLSLCALAPALSAQRVVLPNATGGVSPSGWTVLRTADLEKDERPTDPAAEPARRRLLATIADLRERGRLAEHCLFHAPGAAEPALRLVNAYSQDVNVTSDELVADDELQELSRNFAAAQSGDVEVLEAAATDVFDIGGARLRLRVTDEAGARRLDVYLVPAGKHLQYFECSYAPDDDGGAAACEQLVATFDGATEADVDSTLTNMILGGLLGAILGIGAGLLRRRRLMTRMRQQQHAQG